MFDLLLQSHLVVIPACLSIIPIALLVFGHALPCKWKTKWVMIPTLGCDTIVILVAVG